MGGRQEAIAVADTEESFCAVGAAIGILQEKWVLHIVRSLLDGPRGFNELGRLTGGCNPATLAQRLERLETLGIVHKTVHSYMPPRTTYELTAAGIALQDVIAAIDSWGTRYLTPALGTAGGAVCKGAEADAERGVATTSPVQ
jgi:DNA-binding HxlR family transcriptional regulator